MTANIDHLDLVTPFRTARSGSLLTEALDLPKVPIFYHFPCEGDVNYLGSAFQPNDRVATSELQELLEKQTLETHRVSLTCFSAQEAEETFDFQTHGFSVQQLPKKLKKSLDLLQTDLNDSESRVAARAALSLYLSTWGKKQKIPFTHVIPVDTVCRSTSKAQANAFGAVALTHIDFTADTKKTLAAFASGWKPRVEQALGKTLSEEDYTNLPVMQMVNVWMPLNTFPHINSLALLDIQTISADEPLPYTAVRRDGAAFTAQILPKRPEHKWSVFDIKRGDAIIFGSQTTPHTAIDAVADFPREGCPDEGGRQSVEIRALFLNLF